MSKRPLTTLQSYVLANCDRVTVKIRSIGHRTFHCCYLAGRDVSSSVRSLKAKKALCRTTRGGFVRTINGQRALNALWGCE